MKLVAVFLITQGVGMIIQCAYLFTKDQRLAEMISNMYFMSTMFGIGFAFVIGLLWPELRPKKAAEEKATE